MSYNSSRQIYADTLASIRKDGLYKDERIICSHQGGEVKVRFPAEAPEKNMINLCANNYLGLSSHSDILKAAHEGLDKRGYGMSSVRFICGTQDIHRELENKMSNFLGMEDTCLFASCFDANGALFEAILSAEDAIFSDRLVHASLIDGMRLCKAQRHIFEHQDLNDLEQKLKAAKCRMKLIITDGVFSMDGDMARLDEICRLAEKYDAMVAVDDSHATGFIGKTGRGTHEHFGVMNKVDIITTTFGKALGGATGGCVSARKEIVDLIKQRGRPYLFSNALMPAVVYASLKVIDVLSSSTARRDKLEELTKFWRNGLTDAGFDLKQGNTPIVPIMFYEAKLAQEFSRDLYNEGVFAVGFFYPVVPKGEARIRTQISAGLEKAQLERALEAFVKVGKKHRVLGVKKEEITARYS
ncbi:MAG: glycine C-acetyltransferase [Bdellovibrionales bacterium RIFOXYC1_FULL_54_43]|nr:MAG: glycine C-acetyltransferase [Bdellovibrionales bacterium RIFOXYC1_FULL_54_43]OFZ82452.1 MAG: glycine C-acetyltransferase [Bdellovibrionales bacterium RIFOXYD1_FULL_55_31]